jgi:hypothetical protein
MAPERSAQRATAAVERRPPVAATVQRSAAATRPSAARTLQERLGNQGAGALASKLPSKVSKPTDAAELEAEETARKVTRMREPPAGKPAAPHGAEKGKVQRTERASATSAPVAAAARSAPSVGITGGAPLPAAVRSHMEPRFGASFGNVRVHTGEAAAQQSAALGAHAFTVGEHVFFGRDKFQPQSAGGRELIAHELTHTIQQGAAVQASVQRSADVTVAQRSAPRVQRWGVSDALEWIADKARYIPGFTLLTVVLGVNPITFKPVERNAGNILRGVLELVPVVGPVLTNLLDEHGVFAKVSAWFEGKVRALGMVGGMFKSALDKFLDSLSWRDIFHLGDVWERAKRIFTEPVDRLVALGKSVVMDVLGFIRDAVLLPLAKLAEGTRGYDLLKAVLGKDPITGQPVPRNADTLIGGFMKLIGQEDVWENLKKANAAQRAWAWFQGALEGLMGLVLSIPTRFITALKSLEVLDFILLPKAFLKIAAVFGGFVLDFISWAGGTVWSLLEIILEVVAPGAVVYLKKTGAALKTILKDPLPFVRNLVKAAKLGFTNFGDHLLEHLQAGLIDWLTGSLPGVYIPKALSLPEIAKFTFSVLRISWANIRQKLVKATSETAVKAMETGFDVVVALVREGPAAAWDKIKEQLANLKDMVIGGITDFVLDMATRKAIPKLLSLFIPGAGFISALISIYDTIMVFIHKIAKIIQVVRSFVDSLVDIAAGAVDAAAARVEKALAGLLSLAISFLAGFLGLGNIADKVMGVINKVRVSIDKALDWLVNWIVTAAKKLFAKAFGKKDERTKAQKKADLNKAMGEAEALEARPNATEESINAGLPGIRTKYGLVSLELVVDSEDASSETVHVAGSINPEGRTRRKTIVKGLGTKKNPIPFKWVKPVVAAYPPIELTIEGKKKIAKPDEETKVGSWIIGVRDLDAKEIKDGAEIKVRAPASGAKNSAMNEVLNAHGYDRNKGKDAPRETDHVVEKQLGGADDVTNLWPLSKDTNQKSGRTVRTQIADIKKANNWETLADRWIKLKF